MTVEGKRALIGPTQAQINAENMETNMSWPDWALGWRTKVIHDRGGGYSAKWEKPQWRKNLDTAKTVLITTAFVTGGVTVYYLLSSLNGQVDQVEAGTLGESESSSRNTADNATGGPGIIFGYHSQPGCASSNELLDAVEKAMERNEKKSVPVQWEKDGAWKRIYIEDMFNKLGLVYVDAKTPGVFGSGLFSRDVDLSTACQIGAPRGSAESPAGQVAAPIVDQLPVMNLQSLQPLQPQVDTEPLSVLQSEASCIPYGQVVELFRNNQEEVVTAVMGDRTQRSGRAFVVQYGGENAVVDENGNGSDINEILLPDSCITSVTAQ